jgi:hypothetical protein
VGKAISVERWSYTPIVRNSFQTHRPSFWSSIFWFSNSFSFSEQHFRMTGPAGELMLDITAWIAKQERIRISDRTRAGLARARRQGKVPGGPKRVFRRDEVVRLRDVEWMSWRAIAAALSILVMTALDAYRRTEMVSAGAISSDSSGSTSSGPKDVYATDRNSYTNRQVTEGLLFPAAESNPFSYHIHLSILCCAPIAPKLSDKSSRSSR